MAGLDDFRETRLTVRGLAGVISFFSEHHSEMDRISLMNKLTLSAFENVSLSA